jgi:hypothetical protein
VKFSRVGSLGIRHFNPDVLFSLTDDETDSLIIDLSRYKINGSLAVEIIS